MRESQEIKINDRSLPTILLLATWNQTCCWDPPVKSLCVQLGFVSARGVGLSHWGERYPRMSQATLLSMVRLQEWLFQMLQWAGKHQLDLFFWALLEPEARHSDLLFRLARRWSWSGMHHPNLSFWPMMQPKCCQLELPFGMLLRPKGYSLSSLVWPLLWPE